MSSDEVKQPTATEHLVSLLKQLITEEPSEAQLAALGESLVTVVRAALAGAS